MTHKSNMQRQMFLQISDFLTRYTFYIPYLHAAANVLHGLQTEK